MVGVVTPLSRVAPVVFDLKTTGDKLSLHFFLQLVAGMVGCESYLIRARHSNMDELLLTE